MRKSVTRTIEFVRPFIPKKQMLVMIGGLRGEEREFFRESFRGLEATIRAMPVTYQQSELGDAAVVHLHYFTDGMDWWITEKDVEGGTRQAFGLVDMGHGPELGYVCIDELRSVRSMNIDLNWKPCTIADIKAKKYKIAPEPVKPEKDLNAASILRPFDIVADAPESGVYH